MSSPAPPRPVKPLAVSEQRLRDLPRYRALRERLAAVSRLEPGELIQLLGCVSGGEGAGLVRLLVDVGFITASELAAAKERKRTEATQPLWAVLQEMNLLGERAFAMVSAIANDLAYMEFAADEVDSEAVKYLDSRTALRLGAFPVGFAGNVLLVAVIEPREIDKDEVALLAERTTRLVMAPGEMVRRAIAHWYGSEESTAAAHPLGTLDLRGLLTPTVGQELAAEAQQVVQLVNRLILMAIQQRASDIHISPETQHLHIRFRIDGRIYPQVKLPLGVHAQMTSRIKVLAGMDIAERRLPQDGNIRVRVADRVLDIRVSSVPSVVGEDLVLRLLDHQLGLVRLEQIGFFPEDQERLHKAVLPHGLILVTGPTGSGKSTTLRAALEFILRSEARHVLAVEDPVEVKLEGVTQVQVNPKIQFTFARALRHFLRHDPDVILVGEIRDSETAKIAVQAALTGHLVLSTLHTNDAAGAVTRLLDMEVEPYLVSAALSLVIAQRLVRALCQECRQPIPVDSHARHTLLSMGWDAPMETHYRGAGCAACGQTGFRGRTIVYEMLPVDETIRSMIVRREEGARLRDETRRKGYKSLVHCGARKVAAGITTLEEAAIYLDLLGEGH